MATPQLDFDPYTDNPDRPAGGSAGTSAHAPALDFNPYEDVRVGKAPAPSRVQAPDFGNVQSKATTVRGGEPSPGFGDTFVDAFKRGDTSAFATAAHTAADFVDKTVGDANVFRQMYNHGVLKVDDPEVLQGIVDPLHTRRIADQTLAVEQEIQKDRQDAAERIGSRPGLADWRNAPGDSARRTALRLTNAAGESIPLLAAAVATRNPELGAGLMGGATGAQEYADLRGEGVGRGDAARAAALTGAVETAGEGVGLPAVLGKAGKGSLLRAAISEGAQEAPVQIAQQNIEDQATGRQTPVGEQLLDALDAAAAGGALGAGAHVAGAQRGSHDREVPRGNGPDGPNIPLPSEVPTDFGSGRPLSGPISSTSSAPGIPEAMELAGEMRGQAAQMRANSRGPLSRVGAEALDQRAEMLELEGSNSEPGAMGRGRSASAPLDVRGSPGSGESLAGMRAVDNAERVQPGKAALPELDFDPFSDVPDAPTPVMYGKRREPGIGSTDPAASARAAARVQRMFGPSPRAGELDFDPGLSSVHAAAHEAATSPQNDLTPPTPAQLEAGNFKVGRVKINGLDISIEHPAGVKRKPEHEQSLAQAYGYIRGTKGADGEKVDVFLGEHADDSSRPVFVIDQKKADGSFDEHKAMLGYDTAAAARAAYLANYPKGWEQKGFGGIREMSQDEFKSWVNDPKSMKRPAQNPVALDFDPHLDVAPGTGMRRDHAERLVRRYTKSLPNHPQVVLVDNSDALHRAAGMEAGDDDTRAEGLYNGKPAVFLNLGAIDGPKRFRQVLAHEALGHHGVEQVVGDAWPSISRTIAGHIEKGTGAPWMRRAIAQARASQPGVTDPQDLAREVVAVMAEQGSRNGLIGTVIARTRATLRQAIPSVKWTDGDIRDLLSQGESYLRRQPAMPALETSALRPDDGAIYGHTRPLQGRQERGGTAIAESRVESGRGAGGGAVPAGLDVFLAHDTNGRPAPVSETRLLQSAQVVRAGEFRSGLAKVSTLADAAHVLAPLRKSAQEKFLALALDAHGAPLAVLQHAVGTVSGTEVTPGTVLGAVAALPGVRSVVFAHNHPSANQTPSAADMNLDRILGDLFRGSGIEVKGSIILQPGRDTFTAYDAGGETADSGSRIKPARRSRAVPMVERQLRKVLPPEARTNIGNWQGATKAVEAMRAQHPAGILLLNLRHDVVGHIPFDPITAQTLRTGDPETSQARYVQAAVKANASAAVLYGDKLLEGGIDNMARALKAADIRPLDMFLFDGDKAESQAALGKTLGAGAFFSKPGEAPPETAGVAAQFGHVNEQQRAALGKIATFQRPEPLGERAARLTANLRAKVIQGVVDQFHAFKDLDERAYMQARLSKGTDGAVEGVFRYGLPKLTDGALDIQPDGKGLLGHLQELQGEHDLFLAWVAGHRSEQLAAEDREHLFTPDDISALKNLSKGHMADGRSREAAYRKALQALNRYQSAVLDIAQEAGEINATSRARWNTDFYLPFFRDMGGSPPPAPHPTRGGDAPGDIAEMRKQVIERLVGGGQHLNDLLENTLQNWGRLLSASMKNLAATHALKAAVEIGVAKPVQAADRGTVSAMFHGERKHFQVDDPLVFESLVMLYTPPWSNPAMKVLQWFKRALTFGVTIDPSFRIRNLIRDTLSTIASNRIGYNPLRNLVQGWKATEKGGDTYLKLLGGGGAIRFGSLLDGDQARHAKRLITSGIASDAQILDTPAKVKNALGKAWDAYQEFGDRAETVNRAALYEQARASGKNHLEASFAARDTLDFTNMGAWPAVQFLTRVVPFMNARLQGFYKLGRGAKQDPRRFAAVTGVVAMASVLLHLLNKDDDDYRALPDYVRDSYWWVKLPGTHHALYIPKPFEVGALASVAERATELMTAGDDYLAKDFARTLLSILSQQLSMNPIPQAVRPAMEAAFNYDTFQDRPIDSMGQEQLPAEDRYTARTSGGAVVLGKATGISPQRIEHMVRGYFGWLGMQALNVSDLLTRDLMDLGSNPNHDFGKVDNLAVVGSFIRESHSGSSKYVQRYYEQQRQVDMLYAAYAAARQAGDIDRARELAGDDRLKLRGLYLAADREMTKVNKRIRQVTNDRRLSAEAKAELLGGLYGIRNELAERTTKRAREALDGGGRGNDR